MTHTNRSPGAGNAGASDDNVLSAKKNDVRGTTPHDRYQLQGRHQHSDLCEQLARSGLFDRDARHMLLAVARMSAVPNCDFGACGLVDRTNTQLSDLNSPRIAIWGANGGNQPFFKLLFRNKINWLRKSRILVSPKNPRTEGAGHLGKENNQ